MCILSSAHEPTLLCPAHSSVCFHIQFWTGADENAEPSAFPYPCVFELSVKDGGGHTRVTRGGGGKENQQRLGKPLGQLELLLPAGPQGWGGRGGHRARETVPPATAARRGTEHADRTVFPTIHFSPVRSSGQPSQKPEDEGAPRGPFEGTRLGGRGQAGRTDLEGRVGNHAAHASASGSQWRCASRRA